MSDGTTRNIFVVTSREAYKGFFSDDWGERIDTLARPAKKLYPLIFDLVMEWRAAAYTASLPTAIIDHLKNYHDAFINDGNLNTNLIEIAENVPALLAHELPDLLFNPEDIRRIQAKLVDIGARFMQARLRSKTEFPLEETWRAYLESNVYKLLLWGSQRICYVSIYNSYENLIVHCVKIALSLTRCRTNSSEFKNQFSKAFGVTIRDKCWTNDSLNIVRVVRHSLSHAGGRITEDLAPLKHGFVVNDGRIQVTPEKAKELLSLLQDCVYSLAEKAITLPEFA
jgi:hypothetical protein